jgi:hypothetical protein
LVAVTAQATAATNNSEWGRLLMLIRFLMDRTSCFMDAIALRHAEIIDFTGGVSGLGMP